MADEVIGNIYEVLTLVAIADCTSVLRPKEKIFWNEHPKGVAIEPDITIGIDKDSPRLLLLISHTNAESASHHKFWRNVGESVDARLALGTSTSLANIVFDSGQKRKLAVASEALFDGFIEADRASYGTSLLKLAANLADRVSSRRLSIQERIDFVREYLDTNPEEKKIIQRFAKDLENTLSRSSKYGTGWFGAFNKVQALRPAPRIPSARRTSVRRGLGRLLPIDDEMKLRQIIDAARARKPVEVPDYFLLLGLSSRTLRGYMITDEEILGLINIFNTNVIVELWTDTRKSSSALSQASNSISLSTDFLLLHGFVKENFNLLCKPSSLQRALIDCYDNPDLVLGKSIGLSDSTKYGAWLFDYLMTVIKAHTGKQQGYGYTPLARESKLLIPGKRSILDFALPKYISRSEKLPDYVIEGIAKALSLRLSSLRSWFGINAKSIAEFYLRGLFEDKIYKIASFDPLSFLLNKELNKQGMFSKRIRKSTFLTHFGGIGSATTDILEIKNTVILWQSASDKGVAHKMKELCGRIGMLRVSAISDGQATPNSTYKKAILLIDGTWTDAHIRRLVECGFDAVFYPNELDELVNAIV